MSARTNLYVHSHVSWEQLWWRIVGEMRSKVELGLETHNRFVLERLDWQIMSPQNFMHSFHFERRLNATATRVTEKLLRSTPTSQTLIYD